jgi:hypothetical protein
MSGVANLADKTPHIVLSKTLDQVDWKNTRILRDVEEIRRLKQRSGKDIYCSRRRHAVFQPDELELDR